ncbi:hypothetical protein ABBQ38_004699 [Trebouxia sp. C0009 RCD-2024]
MAVDIAFVTKYNVGLVLEDTVLASAVITDWNARVSVLRSVSHSCHCQLQRLLSQRKQSIWLKELPFHPVTLSFQYACGSREFIIHTATVSIAYKSTERAM